MPISNRRLPAAALAVWMLAAACERSPIPSAPGPEESATAPVAGLFTSPAPLVEGALSTGDPLRSRLATAAGTEFLRLIRYPSAQQQYFLTMEGQVAYFHDWFIGGETRLVAGADGDRWNATIVAPSASGSGFIIHDWPDITFHESYGDEKECFVASAQWKSCNTRQLVVQWYTQAQCRTTGEYTIVFRQNGAEYAGRTFRLLPQLPPDVVPLLSQLDYPDAYDGICRDPATGLTVPCRGTAGEVKRTIAQKGCALTSAAMVLRYHGVPAEPRSLNQWMTANSGYTRFGGVKWDKIIQYAAEQGKAMSWGGAPGNDPEVMEANLCRYGPQIVAVIGSGNRREGHFVVATGRDENRTTHRINDPNGGVATTLAAVPQYRNTYSSARILRGPEYKVTDPMRGVTFYLHSPAELLVTDPQGRRVGLDPNTGNSFAEIPGAMYVDSWLADPATWEEDHVSKELDIRFPSQGEYTLAVTGTGEGTYSLEMTAFNREMESAETVFADIPIQRGAVHVYRVPVTADLSSGSVQVQGGFPGGGQSSDVDAFLSYSAPSDRQTDLPAGTTAYTAMVYFHAGVDPSTFTAELNGVNVASRFTVTPGGLSVVSLPVGPGRNVLELSIRGTHNGRSARDADRLVLRVP